MINHLIWLLINGSHFQWIKYDIKLEQYFYSNCLAVLSWKTLDCLICTSILQWICVSGSILFPSVTQTFLQHKNTEVFQCKLSILVSYWGRPGNCSKKLCSSLITYNYLFMTNKRRLKELRIRDQTGNDLKVKQKWTLLGNYWNQCVELGWMELDAHRVGEVDKLQKIVT